MNLTKVSCLFAILAGGLSPMNAAEELFSVSPSMLSGPLNFFASPAGLTFADPIPYGIVNNVTDRGWIWPSDNSGYLTVDFQLPVILTKCRVFSTYNGAGRGANWAIEHSNNKSDWVISSDFPFETTSAGGVDDEGNPVEGFGGWYEIGFNSEGAEDRYWRIRQTRVIVGHAPRCGQVEFYGSTSTPSNPFLKSAFPQDQRVATDSKLTIDLQDGSFARVAKDSIVLTVNGQIVTPLISNPAEVGVTRVNYDPPAKLLVGPNTYQIVFGDTAVPPVLRTNTFQFVVLREEFIPVLPETLSGSLTFFASPAGLTQSAPIPYGIPNNTSDLGWIWLNESYLDVDFGRSISLAAFRVYSSYPAAARGAIWSVEVSNDGQSYEPVADITYQTAFGGGLNDDGTRRTDTCGWYETAFNQNGTKAGQFWRVRQTGVTLGHAPRSAEIEFYQPRLNPTVNFSGPNGDGKKGDALIEIELQDNLTAVVPGSIRLTLNGQPVSPIIDKPAGSLVTKVSYDPPGDLASGVYTVRAEYANDAIPPLVQNHEFTFRVAPLPIPVCPAMLSGPLNFFASPADLQFAAPVPYGIGNNAEDRGWIWPSDNSGMLNVDLGLPAALNRFRVYSSFVGASRGAKWAVEYSQDNSTWILASDFPFVTTAGGGLNDDFTRRTDFGGWYETSFNSDGAITARYWRIRQTEVLVAHAPRCAQVEFYGTVLQPLQMVPEMLSGPLNFFASPGGLTFKDPLPYGIANNVADTGWIWPNDNSGFLQVDFGQPQVVNLFRVYSTFPGSGRGAVWAIERSDDEVDWIPTAEFTFETQAGAGANEDRCLRTDFGGWYGIGFNDDNAAARYWRIRQDHVTVSHAPRCGQVEFYEIPRSSILVIHVALEANQPTLSWADPTDSAVLESKDSLAGAWTEVIGAFSPHQVTPSAAQRFFRLRQP